MRFEYYDDAALRGQLRGDRFTVVYRIRGTEREALEIAGAMCVEQTVEFPARHIECPAIHDGILGQIDYSEDAGDGWRRVDITYAGETAGGTSPSCSTWCSATAA